MDLRFPDLDDFQQTILIGREVCLDFCRPVKSTRLAKSTLPKEVPDRLFHHLADMIPARMHILDLPFEKEVGVSI